MAGAKRATRKNAEGLTDFLSLKVKDYAEYREAMEHRNSDHCASKLKYNYIPRLNHNQG